MHTAAARGTRLCEARLIFACLHMAVIIIGVRDCNTGAKDRFICEL